VFYYSMPPAADAPPRPPSGRSTAPARSTPASTQRRPVPARVKAGRVRRLVRPALALVTLVLVADALVGENGWFERHREQARLEEKTTELARLQAENAALTLRVDRLERNDPAVIEDLARRKLEMLRQGELLFIEGTSGLPAEASASATAP
jgi:cell division protein FtsB